MNAKLIFGLFAAVAVTQLAVPVSQIWKHEDILKTGKAYKFKCAPVDPVDPFRGRYVALNFADTQSPVHKGDKLEHHGQPAYVGLTEGADGFARFTEMSLEPPNHGDYVRVTYSWGDRFVLPFDKFFMEESQAPKAEAAYRRNVNRRGQTNDATYALVRVKGGRGVIENLYIKDRTIREFLKSAK